ncbi:MAG: S9 family peptidase [Acidobacteriota bacterium]|nr:S9 family peptidase [Acidobacteriota bacterium]
MNCKFLAPGFWLLAVLAAVAVCVSVPAAASGLTPADVIRLEAVEESAVSPDGSLVAYLRDVPRHPLEDENGTAWRQLYVVDGDGESRPFVTGQERLGSIAWTPDGQSITFLVKRGDDEHRGLWAIPIGGGEARKLLSHEGDIAGYSLSPDGEKVAFLAEDPEPEELKEAREKGFNQIVFEEDWRDVKVWIAALGEDAGEPRRLDLPGTASELHWSPKGDRLAVALQPTPAVDDEYTSRKVKLVSATGEVLAGVDNPGKLGRVAWSPDGKRLAMLSAADENDPSDGRLALVDAASGAMTYLMPGLEGDFVDFVWKNDQTLLAVVAESVEHAVWEVSVGGDHSVVVAGGEGCWDSIEIGADGSTVALTGDTAAHPSELYLLATDGPRRLTHHNPWLAERELAPQEAFSYEARDGKTIEGILIRPLGGADGERFPLINDVHGGPESHYCNGWLTSYSRLGQMAAAEGMGVALINYRGSTGRGVAFAKEHQGDPAGKEFDDLVDGVDYLVERGLVDKDRVGIMGGSYGGFATAWGATYYTERYAAGVMFVGISNNLSKAFNTDIPEEMVLVHQRRRVWDDWQFFLERSPIYHAQKGETPLLIAHGDSDERVHPEQSLELYRALKIAGNAPVRHVVYPGEPHGNRKAAARLDYTLRALRWFKHYLAPGDQRDAELPDWRLDYAGALGMSDEEPEG